jgi:hypothetical protein
MMYSIEWAKKWANALDSGKYEQHIFDKSAICQPICMKYGNGKWTAIGILVQEMFNPDWIPYYSPGEMPPIGGYEPWLSEMKSKAKVFCYGALGSAGPIPEKVLGAQCFWPSFYNHVSTENYRNVSFGALSAIVRNYDSETWKPKDKK